MNGKTNKGENLLGKDDNMNKKKGKNKSQTLDQRKLGRKEAESDIK